VPFVEPGPGAAGAGGSGVFTVGSGGAGGVALVDPSPGAAGLVWLFFDSLRGLNRDIYAMRDNGSQLTRITTSTATEREPAVSPDGKTLAYSSDASGTFQIHLRPFATAVDTQLTQDPMGATQPAWSPDGAWLAYHSGLSIQMVKADGSATKLLVSGLYDGEEDGHPTFAPNGAVFYDDYNSIQQLDPASGAMIANPGGFTGPVQHPSLSANGHLIVYNTMCEQLLASVWIAPAVLPLSPCFGGGTRVTSASFGFSRFPVLSPAGSIAFEHGDGRARIAVSSDLAEPRDVTDGQGDDRNPSWAPASTLTPPP
jgi:Tol biopolymer transport system component